MSQAYREFFESKEGAANYLEESIESELDQFGIRSYDSDDNLQKVVADGATVEVVENGDENWFYEVSKVDGSGQDFEESVMDELVL